MLLCQWILFPEFTTLASKRPVEVYSPKLFFFFFFLKFQTAFLSVLVRGMCLMCLEKNPFLFKLNNCSSSGLLIIFVTSQHPSVYRLLF